MFTGEKKKLTKLVKKRKLKAIKPWIGVSDSCLWLVIFSTKPCIDTMFSLH